MGPGHGGPGEGLVDGGEMSVTVLQWGRATEGPESGRNLRPKPSTNQLQWGRATEGPERDMYRDYGAHVTDASMGPGHGGPGEVAHLH